jgi:hypothetical protein
MSDACDLAGRDHGKKQAGSSDSAKDKQAIEKGTDLFSTLRQLAIPKNKSVPFSLSSGFF